MVETNFNGSGISPSKSLSYSPSFLVSFVVDARGGLMNGRRHAGVDVFIPPGKVCQPTRITCRLIRKEKLLNLPVLNEEEAFVSRVLEVGPVGTKFDGPVIIDLPHFGSRVGGERELLIMRSDHGKVWSDHQNISDVGFNVSKLLKDLDDSKCDADKRQTVRIVTDEFPKYFVVITRMQQKGMVVGIPGGNLNTDAFQINVPKGAVTKETKIGLQLMSVTKADMLTTLNREVLSSPIVTIEPRRRRFHQPVSVGIFISNDMKSKFRNKDNNVRLLYSLAAGNNGAVWEDITHNALISVNDNYAKFDTTVSARYWLLESVSTSDAVRDATSLYREIVKVPFIAKFYVLVKRHNEKEAQVRVLLLTDTEIRETLEGQEKFEVVGSSDYVEVFVGDHYSVDVVGNVRPSAATPGRPSISFHPFHNNRLPIFVTIVDQNKPASGQLRISEISGGEKLVCAIDFVMSDFSGRTSMRLQDEMVDAKLHGTFEAAKIKSASQDDLLRVTELKLYDISKLLGGDWVALGKQLGITDGEILKIQKEYGDPQEQAILLLHLWIEKRGDAARASQVEAALKKINREDIVASCLRPQDLDVTNNRVSQLKSIDEARSPATEMLPPLNGNIIDEGVVYEMEDVFDGNQWIKKRKFQDLDIHGDNFQLEEAAGGAEQLGKQFTALLDGEGGDINDENTFAKKKKVPTATLR